MVYSIYIIIRIINYNIIITKSNLLQGGQSFPFGYYPIPQRVLVQIVGGNFWLECGAGEGGKGRGNGNEYEKKKKGKNQRKI